MIFMTGQFLQIFNIYSEIRLICVHDHQFYAQMPIFYEIQYLYIMAILNFSA